jgi:hypothetical protein
VRDNPRRWQLRHDNPQWFAKQTDVVHPRLPPETRWTAYGDHTLPDYPWLEPGGHPRFTDPLRPMWQQVRRPCCTGADRVQRGLCTR